MIKIKIYLIALKDALVWQYYNPRLNPSIGSNK